MAKAKVASISFSLVENGTWDAADYCKFALSIVVLTLHADPFGVSKCIVFVPFFRMAVPLYFLISSVLFFSKVEGKVWPEVRSALIHLLSRLIKLYLFWTVLLAIPTLVWKAVSMGLFKNGIARGIIQVVLDFVLNGTFFGSWYLPASIVAFSVVTIARFRLRISRGLICFGGLLCFGACELYAYIGLLDEGLLDAFETIGFYPSNSFLVAVFWVVLGLFVVEKSKEGPMRPKSMATCFLLGLSLCYAEWVTRVWLFGDGATGATMMGLPLIVFVAFEALLECRASLPHAKLLRNMSTVVYCVHGTLVSALNFALKLLGLSQPNVLTWVILLVSCPLFAYIVACEGSENKESWISNAY